ncbi:MAG: hypothetical protein IJU81_09000 [Bacteroidales bacterium]|nr:hypothetical protein [Bacteroidales bacterium]
MKKGLLFSIPLVCVLLCLTSCKQEDVTFDESLLPGKWVSGTEYYRYDPVGTGVTWDTGDDVSEEEGQPFEWTLDGNQLTHVHIMEMGGRVPKSYTLTELTSTRLSYKDNYLQSFTYTRVNK